MSLQTTPSTTPQRFVTLLTMSSRIRYAIWRLLGWPSTAVVRLRHGPWIRIRPFPETTDYGVAYEVFFHRVYQHAWLPATAETIVDLGGNVGYSVLWWSQRYPGAHIHVYEPMPQQSDLIAAHVRLNGLAPRVTIHTAAVGVAAGQAILEPSGARSVLKPRGEGIPVPVIDVLGSLTDVSIDILKIDIEGSEHALLADPRFATLRVGLLVMEWHNTDTVPQARESCRVRLESAGYEVQDGPDQPDSAGVLWARRTPRGNS